MPNSPRQIFPKTLLNNHKHSPVTTSVFVLFLALLLLLACKRSSTSYSPTTYSPSPGPTSNVGPVTTGGGRSLPEGFRSQTPPAGHGEIITGGMTGNVASPALWAALNSLSTYFDGKPQVLGAIVSADDDEAQALFDGNKEGQPVHGIAYVQARGSQCVVAIVDDRADQFDQSSGDLVRLAEQSLPATAEPQPQFYRVTLSDGTTLEMPGSWTAESRDNGAVTGKGPEGAFDLGLDVQVWTPEAAAQSPYARPPLVSAYGDPGRELQELWAEMRIVDSPESVRIVERAPVSWWTSGPGEILHVQATVQGVQAEYLIMMLTGPIGPGTWHYYYSGVSSVQSSFNKNLPILLRIWKSWKTSDEIFQKRLMQAAESMQATARIIREANGFRQDAMERSSIAWDHIVRGTWPIEDQQTHARYAPQQDVSAVVRQLNESEGYERWHVVPYEQLNR